MTQVQTGYVMFVAALGMMASLLAPEVSALASWPDVFTPMFMGKVFAHVGAVIGAFVAGKMIPTTK